MEEEEGSISHSENEDFENKEETAQHWIYRHLIEFTDCEDDSAKKLVDGDCLPLIKLLTDVTLSMSLFISITIPVKQELPQAPVEPVLTVPDNNIISKKIIKKKRTRLRKKIKKRKETKKNDKNNMKIKKAPVAIEVPPAFIADPVDMVFEWWTLEDIPPHEQFVFIIPKNRLPNSSNQLDELYHVGHMKTRRILKSAISCLEFIFHYNLSFAMKIDLLLLINEIEDNKMPLTFLLEKFVVENIARNFNLTGRIRAINSEARSIALILSQTIHSFCLQQNFSDRSNLLIQLSFFDIEYINSVTDISVTAARLYRALNHISLLQFLYKDEISDWTRKTFLHILDFFSTVLAREITKKSKFMTLYTPDKKVGPICKSLKGVAQKLVTVSHDVFESQEDWSATNKVYFSFYIVGILEEEIDSIIAKISEMNSEKRDMSLDRSAMQAAKVILTDLDTYLQEKCLESAVESGNLDSLRSLAATIVKHNNKLERVVALY